MEKIIECVPNFSEGRDQKTIDAIAKSVASVSGVKLLSVEPDRDYNRTVVTFVGSPEGVVEAAFRATKTAAELIDMRLQKGEHPRLGAVDVVPFIPVAGTTMQECVALANQYGKRVGEELGIPIFLYEEAARVPERRNLSNIRKGEYEGLRAKLADQAWKPDYGPATFNERSGGTVTGARVFLIAYNVNLSTNDKNIAQEIAFKIREIGKTVKDNKGVVISKTPGTLKAVKAMGVLLERHNIAQVSINLTNYDITPPHTAFEEVKKFAEGMGVRATGSEIIGLIPKEAMLRAGRFYAGGSALGERELISAAIEHLGLSQLEQFVPEKKIIELML